MSYYESAECCYVNVAQVVRIMREHGLAGDDVDLESFYSDCGKGPEWPAQTLLRWLGY